MNDVSMSGVQTLVVKSDQEVSIVVVKNFLMQELRGVEGCNGDASGVTGWRECSQCRDREERVGDAQHYEGHCCVRGCTMPCWSKAVLFLHGLWSSQDKWSAGSKEVFRMERQRLNVRSR